MIDAALQRTNMVESQVRPSDVTDRRVIRSMTAVPRERFVPEALRAVAYSDSDLPLVSHSRTGSAQPRFLLAPRLLARMIQALELDSDGIVLEIATATGYGAAVLANIAQTVVALEQDAALADSASQVLASLGADNVVVVTGPLPAGYEQEGPYDAILLNGAVSVTPETVLDQLKDGGRMVGVVIDGGLGRVVQWRRNGATFASRTLFEAQAPVLTGFERKAEFAF